MTTFKPFTKSEYIIWRCETREQLKEDYAKYDAREIENILDAVENLTRRRVEREGGKFKDFE